MLARRIAVVIALAGAMLCIWNFSGGRSAWLDEAGIGLNITTLPFRRLVLAPELTQMAPVGWITVQRGLYDLTHDVDYGLRVVSLLGALGLIYSVWRLSSATGNALVAIVALALTALNGAFVQYAAMIKPYILDGFFTAAIAWLGIDAVRKDFSTSSLMRLVALGFVAIFFSFTALFVLASTGLVAFVTAISRRRLRAAVQLAVMGVTWLATFAICYAIFYRSQGTTIDAMTGSIWVAAFAPAPTTKAALLWYPKAFSSLAAYMFGAAGPLILLSAAIGAVFAWRRDRVVAAILVGPIFVALAASALRAYPFFERFQYGAATLLAVLAGLGLCSVSGLFVRRPRLRYGIVALGAVVMAAHPVERSLTRAAQRPPWSWEETKPSLRVLAAHRRPTDMLIVGQWAEEPFLLYSDRMGLTGHYRSVLADLQPASCALWTLVGARPGQLIWMLMAHGTNPGFEEMKRVLASNGQIELVRADPGASLYLASPRRPIVASTLPQRCRHKSWMRERRFFDGIARSRGLVRDLRFAMD